MATQTKIKLFQSLRKYFQILGIFSSGWNESRLLNSRNVFVLSWYIQATATALTYTLSEATTIVEYGLEYYALSSELVTIFAISSHICQMASISKFVENSEGFIEKSKSMKIDQLILNKIIIQFDLLGKSNITYSDMSANIERWNKIIFHVLTKVSLVNCVVLPPLLITSISYWIYDLKEGSYFLSFPVM